MLLPLLGYLPTMRYAGNEGLLAMALAQAIALLASVAGTVPIWRARHEEPADTVPAQLGAMALRLAVLFAFGLAAVLGGLVPVVPFLIWLAIAHVAYLVPDTLFGREVARHVGDRFAARRAEASGEA